MRSCTGEGLPADPITRIRRELLPHDFTLTPEPLAPFGFWATPLFISSGAPHSTRAKRVVLRRFVSVALFARSFDRGPRLGVTWTVYPYPRYVTPGCR